MVGTSNFYRFLLHGHWDGGRFFLTKGTTDMTWYDLMKASSKGFLWTKHFTTPGFVSSVIQRVLPMGNPPWPGNLLWEYVCIFGGKSEVRKICVCVQDCIQATLTLVVIGSGRTEIVRLRKKSCTILDGWHLINRLWIVAFTTYQLVQDFATIHSTRYPLVI